MCFKLLPKTIYDQSEVGVWSLIADSVIQTLKNPLRSILEGFQALGEAPETMAALPDYAGTNQYGSIRVLNPESLIPIKGFDGYWQSLSVGSKDELVEMFFYFSEKTSLNLLIDQNRPDSLAIKLLSPANEYVYDLRLSVEGAVVKLGDSRPGALKNYIPDQTRRREYLARWFNRGVISFLTKRGFKSLKIKVATPESRAFFMNHVQNFKIEKSIDETGQEVEILIRNLNQ